MFSLQPIKTHYQSSLERFGHTPQGVDWKDTEAQYMRFRALARLFDSGTVNDWGCGYGAFYRFCGPGYTGYDIIPQKLEKGRFILADRPTEVADYTVASGLFNVRADIPYLEWRLYVLDSIKTMNEMSRKGFGFNVLSFWCEKKEPNLYYASPLDMLCEVRRYSRLVEMNHSYSPYDFTLLVRK